MQLHATMVNGVRETFCGDLSDSMAALLVSSLPALPLRTPQQRSWAAACCVAMLDLCEMLSYQGEHAILLQEGHHREGYKNLYLSRDQMPTQWSSVHRVNPSYSRGVLSRAYCSQAMSLCVRRLSSTRPCALL